nr:hypothetical protein [Tanacetum cinerariifolium]
SLGVIVLEYDGLLMMPKDLYAYVEAAMQEPPPPDFVLEPVYPEFMLPEDDVLSTEEQPLPAAVSPNADSPGYITESDLKEDLKEKDDKDPKEDPADYPTDIDYDEEDEYSKADANDEEEDKGEEEEEELLAIPTPPPSPLTSYSSPLPQIPSLPLPTSPTDAEAPLRYRAVMIRYEIGECSYSPTARPTGGFRADYGFVGTLDVEIRRDSDREIELGQRMTDFVTTVRQDTDEIYGRLDDAQDGRLLMSSHLKVLPCSNG